MLKCVKRKYKSSLYFVAKKYAQLCYVMPGTLWQGLIEMSVFHVKMTVWKICSFRKILWDHEANAWEKIMYTVCFETFNNRLPDFASPTWIEIIDYLSFLPESKRYLGSTVTCIGPCTATASRKQRMEAYSRKTPCNVVMPTWRALGSLSFTCNLPIKLTAKYCHPISNRASQENMWWENPLIHLNQKITIHPNFLQFQEFICWT